MGLAIMAAIIVAFIKNEKGGQWPPFHSEVFSMFT
jgi:hypothetical protein